MPYARSLVCACRRTLPALLCVGLLWGWSSLLASAKPPQAKPAKATPQTAKNKPKPKKLPTIEAVQGLLYQTFSLNPLLADEATAKKAAASSGEPIWNDAVISRNQAKVFFEELAKLGWEVTDRQKILERVPLESNYVVGQLQTSDGQRFLRVHGQKPGVIDRLDRMGRFPNGQTILHDLLAGPAGHHAMLAYMISPQGAEQLWQAVGHTMDAQQFLRPTGKIYTAQALWEQLEERYKRLKPDTAKRKKRPPVLPGAV